MIVVKTVNNCTCYGASVFATGQIVSWTRNRERAQVLSRELADRVAVFYQNKFDDRHIVFEAKELEPAAA